MTEDKRHLSPADLEDVLPILNEISVLGGLSEDQLREVFRELQSVQYAKGERVFRQGEAPGDIYVVRRGCVKIVVDIDTVPLELVAFGIGQCFGETSALGILPHSATAVVVEDAELLVLTQGALYQLYKETPSLFGLLILNIAREACRRLQKTDEVLLHYAKPEKGSGLQGRGHGQGCPCHAG